MIIGMLIGLIIAASITAFKNSNQLYIGTDLTDRSWHETHATNRARSIMFITSMYILFASVGALIGLLIRGS